ncbi:MAG: acyl carrier protein [Parachlamydiaceae bacterium]|nr:acyl carrier protein [Parachlamydiaceae bacterium]
MIQEDKLKKAFQQTLHLSPDFDFTALAFAKTEGWDSITHMQLVAAIEETYDIFLETPDVLALSSYPTAIAIVEKYIAKKQKK